MRIIVGLGNPGQQYDKTRHNLGFMVVDALAGQLGLKWTEQNKFKAQLAKNRDFILVKPLTFMNNSGQAVAMVLNYYLKNWQDDPASALIVVHDELDIELGKFKISIDSRSAGHKGVASIISQLKTKNFPRLRIGLKTPALEKIPADQFVMQKFNLAEKKIIEGLLPNILATLLN